MNDGCPTCKRSWTACVCLPREAEPAYGPGPTKIDLATGEVTLSLFDKIRLAREGAAVERCHTHPHLQRYSVGLHSLDLVNLITLAWIADKGTYPRSQLLIAAAFHDVPERIVGDVPQPVKALLGGQMDLHEDHVLNALGVCTSLTREEQEWLAVADKVELYLWCIEEASRGNTYFMEWVQDYDVYFVNNPPPLVFNRIMKKAKENKGERLKFSLLKKVAKL